MPKKKTYLGVAHGVRDGAQHGLDARVLNQAVGDEREHVGRVVEWAGHLGVEFLESINDVGLWRRVADVPEDGEGLSILQKVARRRVTEVVSAFTLINLVIKMISARQETHLGISR